MITLEDVRRLVAIDSVSRHEAALCDVIETQLRANGSLDVQRIGDNLVARTTGQRPMRVMVAGHLDTVPGDASAAVIDGDVLHGVGACDMKASLAGMIALALAPDTRAVETTWVFYAREEIARAESGLLEIIAHDRTLLDADVAVVGEPTDGVVEAGCQGTLRAVVTLRGRRAHVARAFTGRNAIHRLGRLLTTVASYEPRVVTIDDCVFTEQLQAVDVRGGVATNVVPDEVVVTLNHRVAPDRNREEAVAWLRSFLGDAVEEGDEFEIADFAPPARPHLDNPYLGELVRTTGAPPRAKVGWTDVATLQELGVPSTNFGAGDPLLAHRSDEHVTKAQIEAFYTSLSSWLESLRPAN